MDGQEPFEPPLFASVAVRRPEQIIGMGWPETAVMLIVRRQGHMLFVERDLRDVVGDQLIVHTAAIRRAVGAERAKLVQDLWDTGSPVEMFAAASYVNDGVWVRFQDNVPFTRDGGLTREFALFVSNPRGRLEDLVGARMWLLRALGDWPTFERPSLETIRGLGDRFDANREFRSKF